MLALFPVEWIDSINNAKYPDKRLVIEKSGDAHYELVGEMDHGFAKHLRDKSEYQSHDEWLSGTPPKPLGK